MGYIAGTTPTHLIPYKYKTNTDKKLKDLINLYGKKIFFVFGSSIAGDEYDSHEQKRSAVKLNPKSIKGYVVFINPEKLIWRQYGKRSESAVDVLVEEKYEEWFKTAVDIYIDGKRFQVYRDAHGEKTAIQKRPGGIIRVTLFEGERT